MRPVRLAFSGLRSYAESQTISFADKDFIAILGDTGSGKSSILDAICYGLYNRCSWRGGTISDLIAHAGDGTLSVAFTFQVGSRMWRVERSTSARTGAPVHKLLDAETGTVEAAGASAVNARVRRILGLDYDTFLRAVILPQGRFQELLHMGESDRSKVLKSLLGLDQLTVVRDRANAMHTRLTARLTEYRIQRAKFLGDPIKEMHDAESRRSAAAGRLDTLQTAQHDITAALVTASEARSLQATLDRTGRRLADAIPDQVETTYQKILAGAADISARREPLEQRRHDTDQEHQRLQQLLDQADQEHTGVAHTAAAVTTLNHLLDQLPQFDARSERLDGDERDIAVAKALLKTRHDDLGRRLTVVKAAKQTVDTVALRLAAAEQAQQVAAENLGKFHRAVAEERQAEQRHRTCLSTLEELRATAAEAVAEATRATAAVEAKQNQSDKLHAVAVAADGCGPGDPCPVCQHELSASFVAPSADAAKAAGLELKAARGAETKATKKAAAADERARIAEEETLPALVEATQAASVEVSAATAALQAMLGDVDLDAPDEQLMRHLTDAVQTAALEAELAAGDFSEAHDAYTRAKSEFPVLEKAYAEREAAYQQERADHDAALAELYRAARKMPRDFRPDLDLPLTDVTRHRDRAVRRQHELKQHGDRLAELRQTLAELQTAVVALDDELRDTVTKPAGELRLQLHKLGERLTDAENLVGATADRPRPSSASLADECTWAAATVHYAAGLVRVCHERSEVEAKRAVEVDRAVQRIRANCQADDDEHLEQLVRAASTAHHNAKRDYERASKQRPLVEELAGRIEGAEPTVRALADLTALLSHGNFIAEAVRQRQHALLIAANHTLLSISGRRFGFSPNFDIIDTELGRERDVKTLSGGETFQASLALALAVVELASHASGRVDSLFLDEGFGSLDSGVLHDALSALAEHTASGRLVTVISHMRPIAELTNDVLIVERTLTGSRAHWANPDERERIINDDLNRGLLS